MKRIFAMRNFIGVIAVALIFSITMLSTNSSVHAASNTATVTHVEVSGSGEVIKEIKREVFTYPLGGEFHNYMSDLEGYVMSGMGSSKISIGGVETVVAEVEWQKVERIEEQKIDKIPYETKVKEDPTLDKGEEVVDQAGVAGEKTITYIVTYVGGIENSRMTVSEDVTVEPVDQTIRVGTKVTEVKEEQKTEEIPFETKEKEDLTIDKGEKVVDQEGVAGEKTITYIVTYVNGEEVGREIASEEVTVEPVDEIILVGTKVTEVKEEQKTEEIPYETKEKEDPTLDYGEKAVDQTGLAGEKKVFYKVTYVNGEEVDREIASEEVTVEPVDEIIRVGTKGKEIKEEQKTEEIPYETIQKEDPELDKGKEVIDQKGLTGEKVITHEVTYVNGKETNREIISEEIIDEPVNEIIRVGTKVEEPSALKNGVRHQNVVQLKKDLAKAGFTVPGKGTTFYGTQTEKQVNTFQKYYDLGVNGTYDKDTEAKLKVVVNSPLQNGKRHQDTVQLKKDLAAAGFTVPGNETTFFGKQTEKQVKAFQKQYNLVQNGIADKITLKKLNTVANQVLSEGVRHQNVVQLKKDLAKVGFTVPGNGTTFYGTQTEKQVNAFQKYYGLGVNGTYDKDTETKLKVVVNSPLQNGKRHQDTAQLKIDLAKAGFTVPGKGTTLFGKQTEIQVKAFQKRYDLVQNSIADEVTLKKLNTVANQVLSNGVRHQNVVQLKKDLAKAGFTVPGNGTTLYGTQTEEQVNAFQKYYGLGVNGTYDKDTEAKLKVVVNSPLQNGKRHKDTVQLKKELAKAGFTVPGKGTTLFGKQTEIQVKAFQKQYGLVQNSIADEVTLKKLNEVANQPLTNGDRHQDVVQLKKDLAKAGFTVPGNGTTLYGTQTENQVKAFQKSYGLEVNGTYDKDTDEKLKVVVNSPLQNGKRHKDTVQLKKDLAKAGFTVPGKGTTFFGKQTENQVEAFQKKYDLVQNGIADERTLSKLKQVISSK